MKFRIFVFIPAVAFCLPQPVLACKHTEAGLKGIFEAKDDDRSGTLTLNEYYAHVHPKLVPQKMREAHFKTIDLNKDNALSYDEFKAEKAMDKCGR